MFLGVEGLNTPVCLRTDGEENADMKLVQCVTLTHSDVTEHA